MALGEVKYNTIQYVFFDKVHTAIMGQTIKLMQLDFIKHVVEVLVLPASTMLENLENYEPM